jgi:hypothetical protein
MKLFETGTVADDEGLFVSGADPFEEMPIRELVARVVGDLRE